MSSDYRIAIGVKSAPISLQIKKSRIFFNSLYKNLSHTDKCSDKMQVLNNFPKSTDYIEPTMGCLLAPPSMKTSRQA